MSRGLVVGMLAVAGIVACARDASATLPIARKGVSFFYLSDSSETFPWVLDQLGPTPGGENPDVLKRLNSLFDAYRNAGVTEVRILNGPVDGPDYPVPTAALVGKVNNFIRIAALKNLGIEFVTDGIKENCCIPEFMFKDPFPYLNDRTWITNWMQRLDWSHGNIHAFIISGDTAPCEVVDVTSGRVRCYGDPSAAMVETRSENNGRWLATMWPWFTSQPWWPLNASFDAHTLDYNNGTTPGGLSRYAQWVNTYTPTVPFISTPFYFYLAPGATTAQYRTRTMEMLTAYHAATTKPLNIDEFGMHMGNGWTWKDQLAWYAGFFDAVGCGTPFSYQTYAWIGGNDFPAIGQCNFYGLFSEATCGGDCVGAPATCYYVWQGRPAWDVLADYYTRSACLTAGLAPDAASSTDVPRDRPSAAQGTARGTVRPFAGRRPSAAPVLACTPRS